MCSRSPTDTTVNEKTRNVSNLGSPCLKKRTVSWNTRPREPYCHHHSGSWSSLWASWVPKAVVTWMLPSCGHYRCMAGPDLRIMLAAAAASHQSCPTLCDPIDGSPTGSSPWDSPGKNTGVGCQFLLQCMKVKSESEVAQLCLTRSDPMDCSLPGSSVPGVLQARVLEWVAISMRS